MWFVSLSKRLYNFLLLTYLGIAPREEFTGASSISKPSKALNLVSFLWYMKDLYA